MIIDVLYHTNKKTFGYFAEWAELRNHSLRACNPRKGDPLPDIDNLKMSVVLGGSFNVNEEEKNTWLKPEIDFIRQCIDRGKPVFGICLGAQLTARSLGYQVVRNTKSERGMNDVFLTENGLKCDFFEGMPEKFRTMHFHDLVIRLPKSVPSLAESAACPVQAFAVGSALCLQYHPELTPETVDVMLRRYPDAFEKDDYVQTPEELRAEFADFEQSRTGLMKILDNFVKKNYGA